MQQEQSFRYGGTNVNVAEIQKTTRQDFIDRFLPQLVFFRDIPSDKREKELGELWDMCNPNGELQVTTLPISTAGNGPVRDKVSNNPKAKKNGNISTAGNGPVEPDASAANSNNGGN